MRRWLCMLLLAATGCYSTTTPAPANDDAGTPNDDAAAPTGDGGAHVQVKVSNFAYTPANVTIHAGDTVDWVWTGGTHTVTSGADCTKDSKFDSKVKDT